MIKDFTDKVAVITGGAHGIGYALAEACLARGMRVAITASRQSSIDEAVASLGQPDRLLALCSDAGDAEANRELADAVQMRFGEVHLLCLNAGISTLTPIHSLEPETWRRTLAVNLDGPFYGVHAFLPLLELQEQAHIVFTSSIFGFFSTGLQAPYFASKAGLNAFAESLFYDLQTTQSPVGVSLLCPGNTRTNMAESGLSGDEDPELAAAIRAEVASGTDPADVALTTLEAVSRNQFYVLPNTGGFQFCIDARNARINAARNPRWEDVGETI